MLSGRLIAVTTNFDFNDNILTQEKRKKKCIIRFDQNQNIIIIPAKFETKLDDLYRSGFSDYCLHL